MSTPHQTKRFDVPGPLALLPRAVGVEFAVQLVAPDAFEMQGDVAVVRVCGPLAHHGGLFWDSYDAIRERVAQAFDSSAKAVVLCIDSPGGEVAGCFEAVRAIRELRQKTGKPLYAYADGLAASAAYALACAADKIYVPPSGFVGSIGCIECLVDQTVADRQMGLNIQVIASGARKADFNPHVPISEGAVAAVQEQVDSLAQLFMAWVSETRGLPVDTLKSLEAAILHGDRAVSAGLADAVLTLDGLLAIAGGGDQVPDQRSSRIMTYSELMAALRAMAEGDDKDEADKAKSALKAMEPGEDDKAKDAKAESEDAPPPPAKKDDDKDEDQDGMKAMLALAGKVHSLEAKIAAKEEHEERMSLLGTRPDFSAETRKTLMKAPLAFVREAVQNWERINVANPAVASAQVQGTRGETQGTGQASTLPADVAQKLDERMGLRAPKGGIVRQGTSTVFGVMSPDAAKAFLDSKKNGVS